MAHLEKIYRTVQLALLPFFLLNCILIYAQIEPVEVVRGGTLVQAPPFGGITNFLLRLKNATGEPVSDVTVVIVSAGTDTITGVNILSDGDVDTNGEDGDVVDDNLNGVVDPTEKDSIDSSPGRTCAALIKNEARIEPDHVAIVGIDFKRPIAPGMMIYIYFSREVNGKHYNIASADGSFGTSISSLGAGTNNTAHKVINDTPQKIKKIVLLSPLTLEGVVIGPPFGASVVTLIDPYRAEIAFSPAVNPFDVVDMGIRFAEFSPPEGAQLSLQVLDSAPFHCDLDLSDFLPLPCNAFGYFDLMMHARYSPATGVWQDFHVVNKTGRAVSGLQVTFAGTGGSLRAVVLEQPNACPDPAVPSNGQITNTLRIAWPDTCLQPGAGVHVRVYTPNGPITPAGGAWTVQGQPVRTLDLEREIFRCRGGGLPAGPLRVYLDGELAATVYPNNLGDEGFTLGSLPATGNPKVDVQAVWENPIPCSDKVSNAFDAPGCPKSGYFAIESVEQISYTEPFYAPETQDGQLRITCFNPPGDAIRFLNILCLPPGALAPVWIGRNIMLEPSADTTRVIVPFTLEATGAQAFSDNGDLPLFVLVTGNTLPVAPPPGVFVPYRVTPYLEGASYRVGNINEIKFLFPTPGPIPPLPPFVWPPLPLILTPDRPDLSNLDLDHSRFKDGQPGVPTGYAGDRNGCAPASVSNSLSWLRKQHQAVDDSLDHAFSNNTSDSAALRQMMYDLSKKMNRPPEEGAQPPDIVSGKLAFTDQYRVPLRTKYQSLYLGDTVKSPDPRYGHIARAEKPANSADAKISMDWVQAEMNKGEDVELILYWVKMDSNKQITFVSGHALVLRRVVTIGGNQILWVSDDGNQRQPGGLRPNRISDAILDRDTASPLYNCIRVPALNGTKGICFIGHAISESYDPALTFNALALGNIQLSPALCHDSPSGAIRITPTGGVPPYVVKWSNGQTGNMIEHVPAGTYGYTITDAWGNTVTGTIVVPAPPPLVVTPTAIVEPACPDSPTGSITVQVTGGTPPYLIQWNTGKSGTTLSGIPAGIYTVSVTDASGCNTTLAITLLSTDAAPPVLMTLPNPVVALTGCCVTLTPSLLQVTAIDNCGPVNVIFLPSVLDCSHVGVTPVTAIATDNSGNSTTRSIPVTVLDVTPPIAVAQNITVALDPTGNALVSPNQVGNASADNCGIPSLVLSQTQFNCAHVGTNPVTLTAVDASGNIATAQAVIIIVDDTPPLLETQSVTVLLDATGLATIQPSDVVLKASDACGIQSVTLSQQVFYCAAPNKITEDNVIIDVIATDVHGNTTVMPAVVTVMDPIAPTIACPADISMQYCGPLSYAVPIAHDNCGILEIRQLEGLGSGAVFPLGVSTEVFRVTDPSGNTASCSFTVTVTDDWDIAALQGLISCFGAADGFIALDILGGTAPYDFTWSSGQSGATATNLAAGVYSVTAVDANGCSSVRSYIVEQPEALLLTLAQVTDETNSLKNGAITVVAQGGTRPYAYQGQAFGDTLTLTGLSAGDYQLVVTDAHGCTVAINATLQNISGTIQADQIVIFTTFPNPAKGQFRIAVQMNQAIWHQLRLFRAQGGLVKSWPANENADEYQTMPAGELAPGIYWLELKMETGSVTRCVTILR